jgi:hypothetical protein
MTDRSIIMAMQEVNWQPYGAASCNHMLWDLPQPN